MNKIKSAVSLLAMVYLLGAVGCIEQEEGCLDPDAVAIDVQADIPGDCTYPSWNLNLSHRWVAGTDTSVFVTGRNFELANGDTIRCNVLQYYVSNIVADGNQDNRVIEELATEESTFLDDLAIVQTLSTQVNMGTRRFFGSLEDVTLCLGYMESYPLVNAELLQEEEAGHPWLEEGFERMGDRLWLNMEVEVYRGGDTTARTIELAGPTCLPVTLDGVVEAVQGVNFETAVFIDYALWFEGVDWVADDVETTIQQHLEERIPMSWRGM